MGDLIKHLLVASLAWTGWMWAGPSAAETRAVVIGIDKYPYVSPVLRGAVNDADDLNQVLVRRGVRDLTLLKDAQATRPNVLAAINGLIERAGPGDLVIFTFSGHGVRETWGTSRPPGIKEGTQREVFLLYNAALPDVKGNVPTMPGSDVGDRLPDAEINLKLKQLAAKGARVIFVADSCHGGGVTRSLFREDILPPAIYRAVSGKPFAPGQDPLEALFATLPTPIDTDVELTELTFLGAVDKFKTVREVEIPAGSGKMRGAMSYALARVLDGTARIGQGGTITRGALFDYLKATIRTNASNQQEPDLRPRAELNKVVIDTQKDFINWSVASDAPAPSQSNILIRVVNGTARLPQSPASAPFRLLATDSPADANLVYDAASSAVVSRMGDLIAQSVRPEGLLKIAEREFAIRKILALSVSHARNMRLVDGDKRYIAGDRFIVDARKDPPDPNESLYYAMFNIAGDGTVQFLYPMTEKNDPELLPQDRTFDQMGVVPPFGADFLVFIAGKKPLTKLINELRSLDGIRAAAEAVESITRNTNADMQIGVQGLYTGEK